MSQIISNYILQKNANDEVFTEMPDDCKILSLNYSDGNIIIYASNDLEHKEKNRVFFKIYSNNVKYEKIEGTYIGTVFWKDLILHVFKL